MQNAFKAYYDAMRLHDQQETAPPAQQQALADERGDLMLYANTLVGLQEQDIVDHDISQGMDTAVGVNLWGLAAGWIDFHLPGQNGQGERRIDTDQDIAASNTRVDPAGTQFITVDGQTINLDQAINQRLHGLDGDPNNENEYDIGNSGTDHWESYPQRMGSIYHLFANFQQDAALFGNPRDVFDSRAEILNNDPAYPQ